MNIRKSILPSVLPMQVMSLILCFIKSPQGLANAQGNDYVSHWGVTSFPKGWVDRSGSIDDKEKWAASVINRSAIEPKVDINVVSHGYTVSSAASGQFMHC